MFSSRPPISAIACCFISVLLLGTQICSYSQRFDVRNSACSVDIKSSFDKVDKEHWQGGARSASVVAPAGRVRLMFVRVECAHLPFAVIIAR
jgi:hypothetical protein